MLFMHRKVMDDSDSNKVAMYQVDGNFFVEIGSGTEVISDSAQVSASSDAVDLNGLNVVGFKIITSHTDNEQACNFLANTGRRCGLPTMVE